MRDEIFDRGDRTADIRWPAAAGSGAGVGTHRENDRVERFLARKHTRDGQTVGENRRHVLAAVNGEIDLVPQQRLLDFLHEQALAADFGQRRVLQPVARRPDDHDAALRSTGFGNPRGNGVRLPQGELAAARPKAQFRSGRCHTRRGYNRYRGPRVPRENGSTRFCWRRSTRPGLASSCSLRPNSRVSASVYAATASASPTAFSCSVGVSSSFSTIKWVISSAGGRASGGSVDSLKSRRSSSARRIDSN